MGVSGLLDIAKSALFTQRMALDVTGENISNVNTPGYSRQTALLQTRTPILSSGFPMGNGVEVGSVRRVYDDFLQRQIRLENGRYGEASTSYSSMKRVEQLFSEFGTDGLGSSVSDFFNAWQDLSLNPGGEAERQTLLVRSEALVDRFHQTATYLDQVRLEADRSLQGVTAEVNQLTNGIATLNQQINELEAMGGEANEQRDSRDSLVRDLASKVGITYLEQGDGTVTVSLAAGPNLVNGNSAATLSLQPNVADPQVHDVLYTPAGSASSTDITSILASSGGELAGTISTRDTLVPKVMAGLDEMAYTLATQVNTIHSSGYGLNGSTALPFFTPPTAPVPPATFTAGYSGIGGISVAITSTADIAAAQSDPTAVGGGKGDNRNALALGDLRNTQFAMAGGVSTIEGYYALLANDVGMTVQGLNQAQTQSQTLGNQLEALRQAGSGVSLDEEFANLLKYQKAFEGAAKLINASTEMLDTVLNMVR
jgi:flagellar hook-associated protein 1 FlgK